MSTSPRRSYRAPTGAEGLLRVRPEALPFPYEDVQVGAPAPLFSESVAPAGLNTDSATGADDAEAREAGARELGRQAGLAEASQSFEQELVRERAVLASALAQFAQERAAYYTRLETDVVGLALSMARKILHREAQVDPLLLAGIVRVALEKIEGATGTVLVVNPQIASDWRRYMARHMEPGDVPEILEDPALEPDHCQLRTTMGTADLGVEIQLKEIEHGFMDLLAARPAGAP